MRNPFLSASGWSERSADDYVPFVGHVRDDAVLMRWVSAADLRPVTDDRWGLAVAGRNAGETIGG